MEDILVAPQSALTWLVHSEQILQIEFKLKTYCSDNSQTGFLECPRSLACTQQ